MHLAFEYLCRCLYKIRTLFQSANPAAQFIIANNALLPRIRSFDLLKLALGFGNEANWIVFGSHWNRKCQENTSQRGVHAAF